MADWSVDVVESNNIVVATLAADGDGKVWVAQAAGYDWSPDAVPGTVGIVKYDPATCTSSTVLTTGLGPSSIVLVDE
jgi:hypothetical protein